MLGDPGLAGADKIHDFNDQKTQNSFGHFVKRVAGKLDLMDELHEVWKKHTSLIDTPNLKLTKVTIIGLHLPKHQQQTQQDSG